MQLKLKPMIPDGKWNRLLLTELPMMTWRNMLILLTWADYSHDENIWETCGDVLECVLSFFKEYYSKNPTVESNKRFGKKKQKKFLFLLWYLFYLELVLG